MDRHGKYALLQKSIRHGLRLLMNKTLTVIKYERALKLWKEYSHVDLTEHDWAT